MCVAVLGTKHQSPERKPYDGRLKDIDYTIKDREKRALSKIVQIGIEVLEVLLMGTTPLPSKSKPYKWYQKPGNIKHALFDFKAMADQKRGIKYNEAGKTQMWSGYRADRKLRLENPGPTGDPMLEVRPIELPGATPTNDDFVKIIYKQ